MWEPTGEPRIASTAGVRAFAEGFIYNTGRAISGLAPALVELLSETAGVGLAMIGTAALYLLAAMIALLFPLETRGCTLAPSEAGVRLI